MTVDDWVSLGWPREDAVNFEPDQLKTNVIVVDDEGLKPLPHVVRHSPTGYEWGYSGSGPADLALSIVCDVLGYKGRGQWAFELVDEDGVAVMPEPPYQRFKERYIAPLPRDGGWRISADVVTTFLVAEGYVVDLDELDRGEGA
jgi:Family of unknown function (DUF6166)